MNVISPSYPPLQRCWPVSQQHCEININVLPPEVLSEVFHFATENAPMFAVEPVNLSQVSHRWRCIVSSTSTLWTNIKVEETLSLNFTFHRTCNRVKHFLGNSGRLPLVIEVIIHTFYKSTCMEDSAHPYYHHAADFSNAAQTLSRVLAEHVARFKTFNLIADDFTSIADVQAYFPQVSMPFLETWKVHQTFVEQAFDEELEDPDDSTKLLIPLRPQSRMEDHSADMYPNLKVATFNAIPMAWAYFCHRHLQTLNISFLPVDARPTMDELRKILMANEHSLETLIIQGAAPLDYSEPFEMRGVRFLTLGFVKAGELIPLLKAMHVPNLSMLSITDHRRCCTSAADRAFVSYDPTMFSLFTAVVNHLPLDKIEVLHLCCIAFLPFPDQPAFNSPLLVWSRNKRIPVLPMYFFCLMTSLRDLTLIDPDPTTLHCLNYLPKFNIESNFSALPMASLTTLRLVNFNLPLMQLFFRRRIQSYALFPPMDELTFTMPPNWWSRLRFDFSLIAKKVRIIDAPMDQTTEKYFMRRLG